MASVTYEVYAGPTTGTMTSQTLGSPTDTFFSKALEDDARREFRTAREVTEKSLTRSGKNQASNLLAMVSSVSQEELRKESARRSSTRPRQYTLFGRHREELSVGGTLCLAHGENLAVLETDLLCEPKFLDALCRRWQLVPPTTSR